MNWQKPVYITLLLAVLTLCVAAFKGTIKPMNWQKPVYITLLLAVLTLCVAAFKGTIKPMNWQKPVYMLDPQDDDNNGYQNEDFIVWMRTAALPNFRKLYRRVNHTAEFTEGMPKGNYNLIIDYSECVTTMLLSFSSKISLTISVLQSCCAVTTEYGIPSNILVSRITINCYPTRHS